MNEHFIVRCTAAVGWAMAGIFAARLTTTGMVATWKRERAARYDSASNAEAVARRLERKFSGTTWEVSHV